MFNPYNLNNTMPTATQPYGYSMTNMPMYQQQPQQQEQNQFTNIIFVSGIDDVKKRYQSPNSEMYYADNEKPLLYKKIVYPNGQFDVKSFTITEYTGKEDEKQDNSIDLSCYIKTTDLDPIKNEIKALKEQVAKYIKVGGIINGTDGKSN